MPSAALNKDSLLAQVRKLNDTAHTDKRTARELLEDRLLDLIAELEGVQVTIDRLRHDVGSEDYKACKAKKSAVESAIADVKARLDPTYEFEELNRLFDAQKMSLQAQERAERLHFANEAIKLEAKLHKRRGLAQRER